MENKNIVTLRNETIIIDFKELFKRDLSQFNEFRITKRSYHKSLKTMVPVIKEFIEDYDCLDYAYNILYFKFLINSKDTVISIDETIKYLKEKIFSDKKLIKLINDEVDNNYELDLDSSMNVKNENLQITDELNKKYLKGAMLMKLLLPFISAISDKVTDIEKLDRYIFEMFTECLLFINDYDDIILQKVFNIVSSRIIQTRYSDKDIWEFLRKQNKDIIIVIRLFNNYILINNFLKIMNNTSMISYIDVILKNKIGHLFKLDYKVSHKALDYYAATNNNDSNSLTEIDKLEATLLRKDKGLAFINEASIKLKVNELRKKYNLNEDFDNFKEMISINKFTKIFLNIFYKKEFDIVYKEDYVYYLLYDMLDTLRRKGFKLIPKIITSEENTIKNHNKRLIKEKLSDSVKYKLLLDKYKNIDNLVNKDKNFINDLIVQIKQKRFIDKDTGKELELEIEILNEEILDFLFME